MGPRTKPAKKGSPPAPAIELLRRENRRQDRNRQAREQQAKTRADLLEAADKATSPGGRVFNEEHCGAAPFASRGEALAHPADDENAGCEEADARVSRDEADDARREGHRRDGEDERPAPSVFIAEMTDDKGPDGTHQESHGEGGEGAQQGCDRMASGKERSRELCAMKP